MDDESAVPSGRVDDEVTGVLATTSVRGALNRSFGMVTAAVLSLVAIVGMAFGFILLVVQPRLDTAVLATRAVRDAHQGMLDQETGVRGYLLAAPGSAVIFLEPYDSGRRTASAGFAAAAQQIKGDGRLTGQLHLVELRAAAWQMGWALPALATAAPAGGATSDQFLARGKQLFDDYRSAEGALLKALIRSTDDRLREQRDILLAAVATASVGALGVAAVLMRQRRWLEAGLIQPVAELARTVHQVRDGQLDGHAAPRRPDVPREIAALRRDFTGMLEALRAHRDETARKHSSLQSLSELDPLTGLYNRRRLSADLDRECRSGQRSGEPFAVVMLDVDHFKEFNDTRGHQAGDDGLVTVAAAVRGAIRAADTAYRFGGEEFLLLLRGASGADAGHVAERARAAVVKATLSTPLTISAGIAMFPQHGQGSMDLVGAADAALYAAKKSGRNCVAVAGASEDQRRSAKATPGSAHRARSGSSPRAAD